MSEEMVLSAENIEFLNICLEIWSKLLKFARICLIFGSGERISIFDIYAKLWYAKTWLSMIFHVILTK